MEKILESPRPKKMVFDKKSRESYFENLDRALRNLSIVDEDKKELEIKVRKRIRFFE